MTFVFSKSSLSNGHIAPLPPSKIVLSVLLSEEFASHTEMIAVIVDLP